MRIVGGMSFMRASRTRLIVLAAASFSLSACGYDCGELGSTVATGTVRDAAGVTLATADARLSDNLRPTFLRLGVGVMAPGGSAGAPLKGHVTRARLVTESGELLADIPTSTATLYIDAVVALNVDLSSRTEYERIRSALLTGRAKVVLETDLPGKALIETTLTEAHDVPASIRTCRIN